MHASPGFSQIYTPKLFTALRSGYSLADMRTDMIAGLTVAIVAIPLSMAIAIASGAKPAAGLYATIVGGFLISALGGSMFQIGGPAGAFIVLVAKTIETHGFDGFVAATIMAGVILLILGYLNLGAYIKYIPHSATVGFTAGIAVIIFSSQIKDLFGLAVDHEPAAFLPKLETFWPARGTASPTAIALAAGSLALILILRLWKPRFPGFLAVVVLGAALSWGFGLPVETIGSRFGDIPRTLPAPALPTISLHGLIELFPSAIAIALLGGIESLLSAVVADGMTGRHHRSSCELVAQGWANIVSALFGGLCCTGAIARTATNIRAGAHGPVAGILHAVFVAALMAVAAPLASHIPLATLAALLTVVAWNMIERDQILTLVKYDRGETFVFATTMLLTIFRDITEGIAAGVTLGSLLFVHRMAQVVEIKAETDNGATGDAAEEEDDDEGFQPAPQDAVVVYRINGPFFFGVASTISTVLDTIGPRPEAFILDLTHVPLADAAAAHALHSFAQKTRRRKTPLYIVGAGRRVRRTLERNGIDETLARYAESEQAARQELGR